MPGPAVQPIPGAPASAFAAAELIIFDCDGVLVDTEPLSAGVMAEYLTEIGYPLDARTCIDRFTGLSLASIVHILEAEWQRQLPDDFIPTLSARDRAAFDAHLQPIDGVADLARALVTKRCVASSGALEKIQHNLMIAGLSSFFQPYLYSASMVDRGKPAPDLFLYAAGRMGVAPGDALVIEDSVAGVTAARAAGMRVIGFVGGGHCRPETAARLVAAGAHAVAETMDGVAALLGVTIGHRTPANGEPPPDL